MKKAKLTAVLLSAAIMATSAVPAFAAAPADQSYSIEEQQTIAEAIQADPEYQAELLAATEEVSTTATPFDWGTIVAGQTRTLSASAYKLDLSGTSMANRSIVSNGATVTKTNTSYDFVVTGQEISYLEIVDAYPTAATIYYYDANGDLTSKNATVTTPDADGKVLISFSLPSDAQGMTAEEDPGTYNNMIKVSMKTNKSDDVWLSKLAPSMVSPTFFYLFTVND